jgi:hypothetical protein
MIEQTSSSNAVREIEARSLARGYREAGSERDGDLQMEVNTLVNSQPEGFRDSFHSWLCSLSEEGGTRSGIQRMYRSPGPYHCRDGKRALVAHSRHRSTIGGTTTRGVMCDDLRYEQRSRQYSKMKMGSLPWHSKEERNHQTFMYLASWPVAPTLLLQYSSVRRQPQGDHLTNKS